jgi:hypothetical protein
MKFVPIVSRFSEAPNRGSGQPGLLQAPYSKI